jgi:hypothetical protein
MMPDSRDKDGVDAPMLRGSGHVDRTKAASPDPRFDRWLSRRLHEAYDSVLKEPLPAELERLVQQLAAQETRPQHEAAPADDRRREDGSSGLAARTTWSLRN